jgi:hypothetical protein
MSVYPTKPVAKFIVQAILNCKSLK